MFVKRVSLAVRTYFPYANFRESSIYVFRGLGPLAKSANIGGQENDALCNVVLF